MTTQTSLLEKLRRGGRLFVRRVSGGILAHVVDADGARWTDLPVTEVLSVLQAHGVSEVETEGDARVFVAAPAPAATKPIWTPDEDARFRDSKQAQIEAGTAAGQANAVRYDGRVVEVEAVGCEVGLVWLADRLGAPLPRVQNWCRRGEAERGSPGHIVITDDLVELLEARGAEVVIHSLSLPAHVAPVAAPPAHTPMADKAALPPFGKLLSTREIAGLLGHPIEFARNWLTQLGADVPKHYVDPEKPTKGCLYECCPTLATAFRRRGFDVTVAGDVWDKTETVTDAMMAFENWAANVTEASQSETMHAARVPETAAGVADGVTTDDSDAAASEQRLQLEDSDVAANDADEDPAPAADKVSTVEAHQTSPVSCFRCGGPIHYVVDEGDWRCDSCDAETGSDGQADEPQPGIADLPKLAIPDSADVPEPSLVARLAEAGLDAPEIERIADTLAAAAGDGAPPATVALSLSPSSAARAVDRIVDAACLLELVPPAADWMVDSGSDGRLAAGIELLVGHVHDLLEQAATALGHEGVVACYMGTVAEDETA